MCRCGSGIRVDARRVVCIGVNLVVCVDVGPVVCVGVDLIVVDVGLVVCVDVTVVVCIDVGLVVCVGVSLVVCVDVTLVVYIDVGPVVCVDVGPVVCVGAGLIVVDVGLAFCVDVGLVLCVGVGLIFFVDVGLVVYIDVGLVVCVGVGLVVCVDVGLVVYVGVGLVVCVDVGLVVCVGVCLLVCVSVGLTNNTLSCRRRWVLVAVLTGLTALFILTHLPMFTLTHLPMFALTHLPNLPANISSPAWFTTVTNVSNYSPAQLPTYQPAASHQLPTYLPVESHQLPSYSPAANHQLPTYLPAASHQLPTYPPAAGSQLPIYPPAADHIFTYSPTVSHQQRSHSPTSGQPLLTFRMLGRVGNEMFKLASTVGIAHAYSAGTWTLCIDPKLDLRYAFPFVASLPFCVVDNITEPRVVHKESQGQTFDTSTQNLSTGCNTILEGYFQSWKYFRNSSDDVRRLFRFSQAFTDRATSLLRENVERHLRCRRCFDDVITIGVHVRRGDIVKFGKLADVLYLTRAMKYHIRQLHAVIRPEVKSNVNSNLIEVDLNNVTITSPEIDLNNVTIRLPEVDVNNTFSGSSSKKTLDLRNIHKIADRLTGSNINSTGSSASSTERDSNRYVFAVASDDIKWCRQNMADRYDVIYIDTGHRYVDMAVLSMCRGSIITMGTYGWWSAWLAGGNTVYLKTFPGTNGQMTSSNPGDYYPPGWVGL